MPFIPHTEKDVAEMLAAIGVDTTSELFDEIPADLYTDGFASLPRGLSRGGWVWRARGSVLGCEPNLA